MPQLVSYEDLARVMDVAPKSVSDLVAKGMPHEARGQYDVGRCLAWYVRFLHAPISVYEKLLVGWAVTIRQRVLALPARLAGMLVGLDRRAIQDVIDREGREMLLILSQERPGVPAAATDVTRPVVTETETQGTRRGTA